MSNLRGTGSLPTTAANWASGLTGFMNCGFGFRFFFVVVLFFSAAVVFLAAGFFFTSLSLLAATVRSPGWVD